MEIIHENSPKHPFLRFNFVSCSDFWTQVVHEESTGFGTEEAVGNLELGVRNFFHDWILSNESRVSVRAELT